jgi:hypothetical protein
MLFTFSKLKSLLFFFLNKKRIWIVCWLNIISANKRRIHSKEYLKSFWRSVPCSKKLEYLLTGMSSYNPEVFRVHHKYLTYRSLLVARHGPVQAWASQFTGSPIPTGNDSSHCPQPPRFHPLITEISTPARFSYKFKEHNSMHPTTSIHHTNLPPGLKRIWPTIYELSSVFVLELIIIITTKHPLHCPQAPCSTYQ